MMECLNFTGILGDLLVGFLLLGDLMYSSTRTYCTVLVGYSYRCHSSWTGETVEIFMPTLSVPETEITRVLSQCPPAMICVGTIRLLILAMALDFAHSRICSN